MFIGRSCSPGRRSGKRTTNSCAPTNAERTRHYLTLLTLAAERGEDEVAAAIGVVLRAAGVPWPQDIAAALAPREPAVPVLAAFKPELHSYDALIAEPFPTGPGSELITEVSA